MNRRNFTKSLLLGSVAVPTLITGPAARANEEHSDFEHQTARVILRLLALTIVVTSFLVLTKGGYLGISLKGEHPVEPAERLNVGAVPLIGKLFNQNIVEKFASANLVGTLYLIGTTVVLLPLLVLASVSTLWLTHHNQVFKPEKKLRKVKLKTELTEAQIKAGRVIGRAVLDNGILLAMITPSILDKVDFQSK